jgi:cytosine/adenosine deaminase-related metal-dependent hydrolase
MAYRKFTADRIFTGYRMHHEKAVIVTDEKGLVVEIISPEHAGDGVEHYNGIICPGFINCHCHLELSHMKAAIPEHTGMIPFLLTVMNNRNSDDPFIQAAIESAEAGMMVNGIVAVGDICNTAHTIPRKKKNHLYYHNFVEATGMVQETAAIRFAQAEKLFEQFRKITDAVTIVPHAPYSVSPLLLSMINDYEYGSLLTMHNQESDAENELFENGTGELLALYKALGIDPAQFAHPGKSSLQSILPRISFDHTLMLVHNVVTNAKDLKWLQNNKELLPEIIWCLCVNANKYITGKLPDVMMLKRAGEQIVIGTDSLASNHELNILSELKTLQLHFPAIQLEELLQWATSNGARALRIQNQFGSFEKGKKPGVILIEGVDENQAILNATCRSLL